VALGGRKVQRPACMNFPWSVAGCNAELNNWPSVQNCGLTPRESRGIARKAGKTNDLAQQ